MESTTRLSVAGGAGTYTVYVGPGLLDAELPDFITERNYTNVAIVTNETVAPLYGVQLEERLALPGAYLITLPDGERYKTLKTIQTIYDDLLRHNADRSTLIVALGGGVIGDMAGFAAATFMRGIDFVQAPTTLLSMVDASIGGKTGVDLPQGKNLVGAFKDPLAVFADSDTLNTLNITEKLEGMAEVVKAALVGDPALLDILPPDDCEHMEYDDPNRLLEIIRRAMAVKIKIVEQDRLESGARAYLNLGHTFAHAIEITSGFDISHGQAVMVGLVAAARLSLALNLCNERLVTRIKDVIDSLECMGGDSTEYPITESGPQELWEAMQHDKKWRDGKSHFVLLKAAGEPVSVEDVPRDVVFEALKGIGAYGGD